jgi:hypothetical protein
MITYILWGILFTFIFDMILKGTENQFTNLERAVFLLVWPLMLCWFLYFYIKNHWNNGR